MTTYSIRYIGSSLEENQELPLSIPMNAEDSCENLQKELRELLEKFFPEAEISEENLRYEVFSAFPSWMNEEEQIFVNFKIEEIP